MNFYVVGDQYASPSDAEYVSAVSPEEAVSIAIARDPSLARLQAEGGLFVSKVG
jgi:hypothetical protein